METLTVKLVTAGVLFIFTVISGLILSRSGRPFGVGLVTIHKLIAAPAAVVLVLAFRQLLKGGRAATVLEMSLAVISALLFLALIASGALLTREDMRLPGIVLKIHQVAPLLALVCSTATFFLMLKARS